HSTKKYPTGAAMSQIISLATHPKVLVLRGANGRDTTRVRASDRPVLGRLLKHVVAFGTRLVRLGEALRPRHRKAGALDEILACRVWSGVDGCGRRASRDEYAAYDYVTHRFPPEFDYSAEGA